MRPTTYASSTLKPSAHGWRLTFFDGRGDPVWSAWALTKEEVIAQSRMFRAAA